MNCSWCYKTGHNKLGCPELKKAAAPWIPKWEAYKTDQQKAGSTPRMWKFHRENDLSFSARVGLENYIKTQKRSAKAKRCNFCNSTDHNKRTCSKLKEVKADIVKANAAFRQAMVKALKDTGQGIGSLVSGSTSYWEGHGWKESFGVGVVEQIDWKQFNLFGYSKRSGSMWLHGSSGGQPLLVRWAFGKRGYTVLSEPLPDPISEQKGFFRSHLQTGRSVVSPSSKVDPPDDWLLSKDKVFISNVDEYFRSRKSLDYSAFEKGMSKRNIIDKWIEYGKQNDSR